jgi:hypothetical protein
MRGIGQDETIALHHATTEENAHEIMRSGFKPGAKERSGGGRDHVYMGDAHTATHYLHSNADQSGSRGVFVVAAVRKRHLQPDIGSDWKTYLRSGGRKDVKAFGGDPNSPTADDAYQHLGQVRAHHSDVVPLGIHDPDTGEFHTREDVLSRLQKALPTVSEARELYLRAVLKQFPAARDWPEVAADGRCFRVLFAEGMGGQCFARRNDALKFALAKKQDDDLSGLRYMETPKGTRLRKSADRALPDHDLQKAVGYRMAQRGEEDASQLDYYPEAQKLVHMHPDTFLKHAHGDAPENEWIRNGISRSKVDRMKEHIQAGKPLDAPFLDVDVRTGEVGTHEGRHRSIASRELGIERVPVILYHRNGSKFANASEHPHIAARFDEGDLQKAIALNRQTGASTGRASYMTPGRSLANAGHAVVTGARRAAQTVASPRMAGLASAARMRPTGDGGYEAADSAHAARVVSKLGAKRGMEPNAPRRSFTAGATGPAAMSHTLDVGNRSVKITQKPTAHLANLQRPPKATPKPKPAVATPPEKQIETEVQQGATALKMQHVGSRTKPTRNWYGKRTGEMTHHTYYHRNPHVAAKRLQTALGATHGLSAINYRKTYMRDGTARVMATFHAAPKGGGPAHVVTVLRKGTDFDEEKHPRAPQGSSDGGRFVEKQQSGAHTQDDILAQIASIVDDSDCDYFGLRVLTPVSQRDDTRKPPEIGAVLPPSRRWVDNTRTRGVLPGTSALRVPLGCDAGDISQSLARLDSYFGRYIVLLGSNYYEHGEDRGEVMLRDAEVLAVLDRGASDVGRWAQGGSLKRVGGGS